MTLFCLWHSIGPFLIFICIISALFYLFASFAGTFTLSNLGMFGVDRFDAILPPGTVGVCTQFEYIPIWFSVYSIFMKFFYAGSNNGCWSLSGHCCSNQGWSDWHEEPDAGMNLFLSSCSGVGISSFCTQRHRFLTCKLAIFTGKCYSWPSCDIWCWSGFILANPGEDHWGSQRSYILV